MSDSANGSATTQTEQPAFQQAIQTIELDDLVVVSVLSLYFIQKLGKPSLEQIFDAISRNGGEVDKFLLEQAVEALRARGLTSYSTTRVRKTGEQVRAWKTKKVKWGSPPEMAHLTALLPRLIETDEAKRIIAVMNDEEVEDGGEKKAMRDLGFERYVTVQVEAILEDEILGSQPPSPWLDELCRLHPHGIPVPPAKKSDPEDETKTEKKKTKEIAAMLRFCRDSRTGAVKIPSDVLSGWLRTGARTAGFGETIAKYISVSDVLIVPKQGLRQIALPIIDQGVGAGIATYELLPPGEHISMVIRFPTKGFMTVEGFKVWIMQYGINPLRGLSPARGKRHGKIIVTGFKVLADVHDSGANQLRSVLHLVPEEHRAFYEKTLEESDKVFNHRSYKPGSNDGN